MTAEDYATASPKKELLYKDKSPARQSWWVEKDPNKIFQLVFQTISFIDSHSTAMRHEFEQFRHAYGNPEAFFIPTTPTALYNSPNLPNLRINVVQSCIDTAASMIAKNQPKPEFFTMGQDNFQLQQKAKTINAYIDGVFDTCGEEQQNIYQVLQRTFLDSAITGTGAVKIFIQDEEVKAEWVQIDEIIVDQIESAKSQPLQIHRRKWIARDQLSYMFPDHTEELLSSSNISQAIMGGMQTSADLVEVIESWHLKSGKHAKDGKHTICVDNATLLDEPYDKPFYPIIFFRWQERPYGFWGRGIAEEIFSIQDAIDHLVQIIRLCQELVAVPIVFAETGSQVNSDHLLANDIFRLVEYSGPTPPTIEVPTAVNPELYNFLDWLINQAYQITGVSQANASGTKPPDVKSGTAIEMVADIASGRFELKGQAWERLLIQIAKVVLSFSRDLYKDNKSLSIKSIPKKSKYLQEIKFADIADIDDDDMAMRCFPVSGLSSSPAGRMDQIMQYVQSGWIDKDFGMQLINFPDLEEYTNLETAPLELIRKILSKMVNDGKYTHPVPFMNLSLAIQLGTLELMRSQLDGVEEANCDLIRDFINECQAMLATQASQTPPNGPATQASQSGTPPNNAPGPSPAEAPQTVAPPQGS